MVKLLLFPFALILAFVSAQADDKFYSSDANNPFNFIVPASSNIVLAYWTSDINNEITLEGFGDTYNSRESNAWNFFQFSKFGKVVIINPRNKRYQVLRSYDLRITITSTKKTYWRSCDNITQCVLPAPVPLATECPVGSTTNQSSIVSSTVPTPSTRETALEITSMVLLSICCVLVAIVTGMAVYIIRGRRASLNEPGSNMNTEAIYEEVELPGNVSRAQQNHVIENVIYGAVIPRQA
ncbi:uncharacterized protein [Palaemon carinicauda]|uniref:uncharacterized protein n=1 Tax=Palaemon carinicauda TaxID=392227 RepID=UPI0035B5A4F1